METREACKQQYVQTPFDKAKSHMVNITTGRWRPTRNEEDRVKKPEIFWEIKNRQVIKRIRLFSKNCSRSRESNSPKNSRWLNHPLFVIMVPGTVAIGNGPPHSSITLLLSALASGTDGTDFFQPCLLYQKNIFNQTKMSLRPLRSYVLYVLSPLFLYQTFMSQFFNCSTTCTKRYFVLSVTSGLISKLIGKQKIGARTILMKIWLVFWENVIKQDMLDVCYISTSSN